MTALSLFAIACSDSIAPAEIKLEFGELVTVVPREYVLSVAEPDSNNPAGFDKSRGATLVFPQSEISQAIDGYVIPKIHAGNTAKNLIVGVVLLDETERTAYRYAGKNGNQDLWNRRHGYANRWTEQAGASGLYRVHPFEAFVSSWSVVTHNIDSPSEMNPAELPNFYIGECSMLEGIDASRCITTVVLDDPAYLGVRLHISEENLPLRTAIADYIRARLESWRLH